MAEFKLGRIRFVWKNQWTASTTYYQDDVVAFGGKTYICVIGHTSQPDFFTDLDIVPPKWNLVSDGQTWKGEWQTNTDYVYDDIVSYGARLYICNTIHTSAATITDENDGLEADLSKWTPYAEGLYWKGDWEVSTRYRVNDFVKYGGTTYVCNTLHVSAPSLTSGLEEDIDNWDVFNRGIEFKGTWAPSVRYKVNDLVRYGAGVWIANTAHTSASVFLTDNSKWTKFVEGFQYENDWSPFRAYQPGDIVRYGGNQYISTTTNTAQIPSTNSDDWDLFTEGFRLIGDWNEDSANQHYKVGELVRLGGYTYVCVKDHTTAQQPPDAEYWTLVNEGFRWRGAWLDDQEYYAGDVVRYGDNSYICILGHISEGDDGSSLGGAPGSRPDSPTSGTYWNVIAIGTEQSVLTTTGDLVYYSGAAPTRLPIGLEGQVLKVNSSGIPNWEFLSSVEDVYYVAEHGADLLYPTYGGTLDRPWKTIRFACEQVEKGVKNPIAQQLLSRNRIFIQREVSAWIRYQVDNALPGSLWENFTYDTVKCERDVGFVIDRIIHDLGHGGNLKVRAAAQTFLNALADGPYSTAEENNGTGPYGNLAIEGLQSVEAYTYMLNLIEDVINNDVPATIYQNVTDDSTAIVDQYFNTALTVEAGALGRITELANIVINALSTGDVETIPEREVPQSLIKVSTGRHYEVLPIVVPAYTCVQGEELRSTQVYASEATIPASDSANTVATFDRFADVIKNIVTGATVTPTVGNPEVQSNEWPYAIATQATAVEDLAYLMKYQVDYRLNTMHSASLTDPTGYSTGLSNARANIRRNRKFIIEEVIAYLADEYPTLRYGKTDTRRDARYVLDALEYDLTYGGNAMSVQAGLAYWGGEGASESQIPASIKAATIASLNFLKTTAQSVAGNVTIVSPRQEAVLQQAGLGVGSIAEIANLVEEIIDILDNGPSAASLTDPTPANGVNTTTALITASNTLNAASTTIRSNTISWINSNYPNLVYDSTKCSRDIGIILKAIRFDFMFNTNWQTLKAAHSYLRGSASEVYTLNQKAVTREAIRYALKTLAVANVGGNTTAQSRIQASADIIDRIIFGASNEGSVCQSEDQNVYYAIEQLERNREFIKAEINAWIASQIAGAGVNSIWYNYTYDADLCLRDVDRHIDAIQFDLKYPGNYKSRYAARYYTNAVTGSQEEDMFYLRDATGIRDMTVNGLNGDLTPPNTYGTSRVTAGAYCSLDPGWGPADFTTWILSRSPYVQGVTTFGNAAIGQKIDGALHNGGNDSIVSNDFTQVISDGIGAWIVNNGRAELVSVFTYYAHIGYLAETGGRIRATNGNNSYGLFGSVAEGVDPEETPVTAIVDNSGQYKATISEIYTDSDKLFTLEYGHAGNDYTEAVIDFFGAGNSISAVSDEFRDNAVNYVLVDQDPDPTVPLGGSGYVLVSNVAQSGTTTSINISATDGALSSAYVGMKMYIIGGAGAGQYGIISSYNAGSKQANIIRESDGVAGWDHAIAGTAIEAPNSSSTYQIEPRILFSAPTSSNASVTLPSSSTWRDIKYIETANQYTGVATTTSGSGIGATFNVTRNGEKYYVSINNAGTGYSRLDTLTIAGTLLEGASTANDITITATSVNSVTGAIVDFDFVGTARKGKFLAIGSGTTGALSIDGITWSAETLPSLGAGFWSNIASGLQDDGSSTFKPSAVVVVADGSSSVAYSGDADVWLTSNLPVGMNTGAETRIAYGNIVGSVANRFVVISSADRDTAYSDNGGATWTLTTDGLPSVGFSTVAYGAGKFVAVKAGTTDAAYSANGITWNAVTLPGTAASVGNVVWGNGRFITLGGTNGIMYSFDGITWYNNALSLPISVTERKIAYGQGMFAMTSSSTNQIQYSEDGLYWQAYTISTAPAVGWNAIAFGNPDRDGKFIAIADPVAPTTIAASIKIGARTRGRASVSNEQVFEVRIIEPGSGYTSAPTITVTDPNNVDDVVLVPQLGDGVLGQPTFINRGTGYTTASAEIDSDNSNGNANFPQYGNFIAVKRLSVRPVNGSNVEFSSLPGQFFKLVNTISFLGTNPGSFTGFLQISPSIPVEDSPPNADPVELRIRYSQVRLTGHDFLDIGTGGFTTTNYPNTPLQLPVQANETVESNGGRVFYTATDQDGNFRVGGLFSIEQSTGVATLNADAFNIAGLQELSLGEVTLGGNSATINEFSTDPFFTANSDNIVPTQRAIKAYIESQIGGGGASLNVNSVTAGDIFVGTDTITTVSGSALNIKANVVFSGTVLGLPLAYNYFLR